MTYAFTQISIAPGSWVDSQIWQKLAEFQRFWQKLAKYGSILPNLTRFGRIWQSLVKFGKIWQNLAEFDRTLRRGGGEGGEGGGGGGENPHTCESISHRPLWAAAQKGVG